MLHMRAQQIKQQRLLVIGIVVKGAGLYADLGRDLAHRDGGKPVLRNQPQRSRLHARAGDFRMRARFPCHDVVDN